MRVRTISPLIGGVWIPTSGGFGKITSHCKKHSNRYRGNTLLFFNYGYYKKAYTVWCLSYYMLPENISEHEVLYKSILTTWEKMAKSKNFLSCIWISYQYKNTASKSNIYKSNKNSTITEKKMPISACTLLLILLLYLSG